MITEGKEISIAGVLQGPMGSELRKRGIGDRTSRESHEAHEAIHREYQEAGAHIAVANTFGATTLRFQERKTLSLGRDPSEKRFGPVHTRMNATMVEIARRVFKDSLLAGSVAPIMDSSGLHDHLWKNSSKEQRLEFLMNRHDPQVNILLSSGVDILLGEALRYQDEAEALVRLAHEFGTRAVAVCFEANNNGLPFVMEGEATTFQQLKAQLQRLAPDVKVLVGANCTGLSVIESILLKDNLDIIHANFLDFRGDQVAYATYAAMKMMNRPEDQEPILTIERVFGSSIEEFNRVAGLAFERNVQVVGGCCGTTPHHTQIFRKTWDEFVNKEEKEEYEVGAAANG